MVQIHAGPPPALLPEAVDALSDFAKRDAGAVAQLGERGLCKPEVVGSIPISSTNPEHNLTLRFHREPPAPHRRVTPVLTASILDNRITFRVRTNAHCIVVRTDRMCGEMFLQRAAQQRFGNNERAIVQICESRP